MEKETLKPEDSAQQCASSSRPESYGSGSAGERSDTGGQRRKSDSTETSRPKGESKSQESALGSHARTRSGVGRSPGLMQYAGIVSPEFPSLSGTPNSISQLLTNLPSSTFSLEGLEYVSPLGSGIISPLTASSHKLGRKRPISISPLSSSSQLDLNNLIRSSPSSLINCISTSRGDSAGSIGHLSPSLAAPLNPTLFASPHKAPLFTLRNAAHPPPLNVTASFPLNTPGRSPEHRGSKEYSQSSNRMSIKQEPLEESSGSQPSRGDAAAMLQFSTNSQESGFNSQPRELETLHEEDDILSDDEMQTDPSNSDCSSRYTGEGESQDSKRGVLDRKPRRVYYSYPSVEEPHNNTCRWAGCDARCQDLNDLVRHVNTDHIYRDSKKEFVCQWASCVRGKKPFKAQYMLLVHMRRHTGEKPHRCTYEGCNKAYSRLENLKTHLRSHTGERPYMCKYEGCGKAFSNASDCAKHMNRTHSSEKPYACLNPGCTKRYTDPSSRRKHMKNCQVNKKPRVEDGDGPSVTEDDSSVETPSRSSPSSSTGRAVKLKKPDKNKMPPVTQKKGLKGESRGTDLGYISEGSQGQHSPLKGYGSPPAAHEGEYPTQWKREDEISTILRHQTLSDPNDPTSPMAMAFSPHSSGGAYPSSIRPHVGGGPVEAAVPMDQATNHMTANPNGKASRQRGGGLMPAGRTPGNPQAQLPAKTFHHLPSQGAPLPHPPPSYHQPPLYSQSRPNHYNPFLPSFQCFPSGYSSLPAESRQPLPPSSVPYTQLPHQGLEENENIRINHTPGNLQTPLSSGYSSSCSSKGVHQKSPSEDSSVTGGASLHSNPMTNSYSTFSSNSSRVSSPSNSSNHGNGLRPHHLSATGPLQNQFMTPKTSPRGQNYPLNQSLRMPGTAHSRQADEMSESSGRSWVYSSQSSRYSTFSATGSELSDDVLDSLPTDRLRQHNFTKDTPLPLPKSMQDQFEAKLNGMGAGITGMECSPPHGNGTGALLGDTYHPQSPVSMQLDFHGDKTMPLYHLPPESAAVFTPNDAHLPFYSNSQCTADNFEFQMNCADVSMPNMVFNDMASFTDDTHYLETLLSSQTN